MRAPSPERLHLALVLAFLGVLVWSGINPRERFTWLLEVLPTLLALPLLVLTYRRFRLTTLAYVLIFVHACILCVGGHHTYAEVPIGHWAKDTFGFSRNPYDRVGHFAQGFVPAILTREILLRLTPLRPGGWLNAIVVSVALAVSATYELIEWAVAEATGTAAESFLGTQGDVWDTQKDMLLALLGAITALATLSRAHDRALARLPHEREEREPKR